MTYSLLVSASRQLPFRRGGGGVEVAYPQKKRTESLFLPMTNAILSRESGEETIPKPTTTRESRSSDSACFHLSHEAGEPPIRGLKP